MYLGSLAAPWMLCTHYFIYWTPFHASVKCIKTRSSKLRLTQDGLGKAHEQPGRS